jgi:hypothetical protein
MFGHYRVEPERVKVYENESLSVLTGTYQDIAGLEVAVVSPCVVDFCYPFAKPGTEGVYF